VISFAFLIGSAVSGAAGVMFGLMFSDISNTIGFENGLKAFTAAVIGGIGSIPGAMLGGLVVGLAEAYSAGYLPSGSTFQDVYVFTLLIIVLLVRPTGLLGKADIRKV
jgi:branched-subunit amino acid ABC-type transport system permease component